MKILPITPTQYDCKKQKKPNFSGMLWCSSALDESISSPKVTDALGQFGWAVAHYLPETLKDLQVFITHGKLSNEYGVYYLHPKNGQPSGLINVKDEGNLSTALFNRLQDHLRVNNLLPETVKSN